MILCTCGQTMKRLPGTRSVALDTAMGTYTRHMGCDCGEIVNTVEMRVDELSRLRRMAHLYLMSGVKQA